MDDLSIADATLRLLAAEQLDDGEAPMSDEESVEFEASLSDETWLAAVAVLLAYYTADLAEAIGSIEANRDMCLKARGLGFEAWELAQYAAVQMGLR